MCLLGRCSQARTRPAEQDASVLPKAGLQRTHIGTAKAKTKVSLVGGFSHNVITLQFWTEGTSLGGVSSHLVFFCMILISYGIHSLHLRP